MAIRPRRVPVLALAFLLAACGAQVAAPRPTESPSPTAQPSATPRPANAANDVLYVRAIGAGGQGSILVIDARTGETKRTFADGAVSADRSTLYWPESVNGATTTLVHVADLTTGRELRSFSVDGYLKPFTFSGSVYEVTGSRLSQDSRYIVLTNPPYKNADQWVTKLVVVETSSGAVLGATELRSVSTYGILALSPDARSLFLDQFGEGGTRTRFLDVRSGTVGDVPGAATARNGFRTAAALSADGRWLYRVDVGDLLAYTDADGPSLLAVDMVTRRAVKVALPIEQKSWDFEKYMLWSFAESRDGATLYAINPSLGVIDEIDARSLALRRARHITVSRSDAGPLAALASRFFGVAEAKRYLVGGAVLSPDGRTLYAVAHDGVSAIDTSTLESNGVWMPTSQFDALAISADGLRLYGVDNQKGTTTIVDTRSGAKLGELKIPGYIPAILRIDGAP